MAYGGVNVAAGRFNSSEEKMESPFGVERRGVAIGGVCVTLEKAHFPEVVQCGRRRHRQEHYRSKIQAQTKTARCHFISIDAALRHSFPFQISM
jgi:hypothetical protein